MKYKYDYSSHVRSEFLGTGQNNSDIYVTASVILTFPTKCEGILKLQEVELRTEPLSKERTAFFDFFASPLHSKSLHFASDLEKNELRYERNAMNHFIEYTLK